MSQTEALEVRREGEILEGWKSVRISRAFDRLAASFALELAEISPLDPLARVPDFTVEINALGIVGDPKAGMVNEFFRAPLEDNQRDRLWAWGLYDFGGLAERQDEQWRAFDPDEAYELLLESGGPPSDRNELLLSSEAHFRDRVAPEIGFTYNVFSHVRSKATEDFSLEPPSTAHIPASSRPMPRSMYS